MECGMSGGHFNYKQYELGYIVDDIEQTIIHYNRDDKDDYGYSYRARFTEEEIAKFKEACYFIEKAQIYAQRIDWLLSGDDGADSFFRRLEKELNELDKKYEQN